MINRPVRGGFDEGHANNVNPVAKYRNPPPRTQYMFIWNIIWSGENLD